MAKLKQDRYTLVQHSGFGYAGKPGFEHAVEERHISTEAELAGIQKIGGVVFETYMQASDAADAENYPPEVEGMYPKARGKFASYKLDGLRVYIPKQEAPASA